VHPLRHPSAPAAATIDSIPSDTAFGTIKPLIRALLEEEDGRLEKESACIEQMAARLDDKDALIKKSEELANAREIELIRAAAEVHAVYSPRAIISSIIETLSPGACGIAIGEKHINSFIDKYIYNTGKGLGAKHPSREFTDAAADIIKVLGTADVRGIHQSLDRVFQDASAPHHNVIRHFANFAGVMIGGVSSTESQRTALALIIALGQQELLKLMGTYSDPMIDPVGLNEPLCATEVKEDGRMVFIMKRQITCGHVQGIP
jgi:hypothetical protein